jgi:hypothetical protein
MMIAPRMSYPPPLPVSPLQYDHRMNEARPGIITAVGVMSIIIGCISGLMSLSTVFSTLMFFAMSKMPIPGPMTVTPPGAVTAGSGGSVTVGGIPATADDSADAMAEAQRRIVVDTLAGMSGLDEQRQKQLELLLSVSGQKVFPFGDRITPQLIRSNVTERGTLPPSPGGGAGATYFLVGTGRLEVYDDHAVFRPDGSSAVVSATTNPSADDSSSTSASSSSSSTSVTVVGRGGRTRSSVTMTAGPPIRFNMSKPAMLATVIVAALNLCLAIYLLVIGIMVLRDALSGRKLHWIYVVLKIPLVIAGGIAGWFLWRSFGNSFMAAATPPGTPAPPMGNFMALSAVFSSLFALAYPIALIFVMSSRTAKRYYSAERI